MSSRKGLVKLMTTSSQVLLARKSLRLRLTSQGFFAM